MQYEIRISKRIKNKILGGKQVFTINEIKKKEYPTGSLVKLICGNEFVAWATINPKNPKRYIRILSLEKDFDLKDDLIKKLKNAKRFREKIGYENHYRWVYSESDFLSGLIIDKYNDIVVIQNNNPFYDKNIEILKEAILEVESVNSIYEKSVGIKREEEFLLPQERFLYGDKSETIIEEYGKRFFVNIVKGQKTGWFLDQKENRKIIKNISGEKCLDVFSYTGSFGILINCEERIFVEKDKKAVEILEKNLKLNNIENYKIINDDAYSTLKQMFLSKEKYDILILDPPDLLAIDYRKGLKSLILINSIALDLIDQGFFITFSCSQDIKEDKFYSILRTLIRRKNKRFELVAKLHQALDHKIIFPHKELEYLKGFIFEIF